MNSTHVVLVNPEIHWNTGNAGRTCLAAGAALHLVAPLGFSLDEREVKRAGLDYWPHVDLHTWPSWEEFETRMPELGTPFFFAPNAPMTLWDAPLATAPPAQTARPAQTASPESKAAHPGVVLVFGRESDGLPAELLAKYADRVVSIPMVSTVVRSLNLSTSVAIALYEVMRQRRGMASSPIRR
jgi:tRNA (cytidine/uridine-2'-O-)-methyltransferase